MPFDSPGSSTPDSVPNPNFRNDVVHRLVGHLLRGDDGAEVRRLRDDSSGREVQDAVLPVVTDLELVDRHARRHHDRRLGCDLALVGERGERDRLHDRAGLVDVLHGARDGVEVRHALVGVGIERRCLRHLDDLAGADVHGDGKSPVRAGGAHGIGEPLVAVPLQVAVDRRQHVAARHHLLDRAVGHRDALPARRDLVGARPVHAGELLVVLALEALHALAAAVDEADEVGCERSARVGAQRLLGAEDPGEPGLPHRLDGLLRRPGGNALLEIDEAGVWLAQLVDRVEVVDPPGAELLDQDAGDARGVLRRHARVGGDGHAVDAGGEVLAVAVEDLASRRGNEVLGRAGLDRHGRVRLGVEPLDLEQPQPEDHEEGDDEHQARPHPAPRQALARHRVTCLKLLRGTAGLALPTTSPSDSRRNTGLALGTMPSQSACVARLDGLWRRWT